MKNKQILGALALDLKRVALGYFRGSTTTAERFYEEALKRKSELDNKKLKPYLTNYLNKLDDLNKQKRERAAEDALLYSTIFQNATVSK
jgi:hypothetical protein